MDSNDQHRQKNEDFISSFFFFFPSLPSFTLSSILVFSPSLTDTSFFLAYVLYHSFTDFHERTCIWLVLLFFSLSPSRSLPLNYVFTLATSGAHGFRPPFGSISNVVKLKRKREGKVLRGSRRANEALFSSVVNQSYVSSYRKRERNIYIYKRMKLKDRNLGRENGLEGGRSLGARPFNVKTHRMSRRSLNKINMAAINV